tara:strand:+ start:779 stop:1441 length:663 start_codon:yes stop_codon:yes gene_type:complete
LRYKTETFHFDNMGFIDVSIPDKLFKSLKEECGVALDSNDEKVSGLSGAGVPTHRNVENKSNLRDLEIFIFSLLKGYKETFKLDPISHGAMQFYSPLNRVFKLGKPWINYQKKNEFIPNHIHDGIFSYTIWMDIPYDSNEELKEGGNDASCFQFSYTDILGITRVHNIRLNKKDNGRMLFFPAKLRHQVYPFYTTDKYRVSISGNVMLDIEFNDEKRREL